MFTFKSILPFNADALSVTPLFAAMILFDNETVSLAKRLPNISAVSAIFTLRSAYERRLLAVSIIA